MKKHFLPITTIFCALIICSLIIVSCKEEASNELSVQPESLSFAADAKSTTIAVIADGAWTASSSETWCTVNPTSGKGNVNVTVSVPTYNVATNRTAEITITNGAISKAVVVTQTGIVRSLTANPNAITLEATEVFKTVDITSNVTWTASSDKTWCKVSPAAGSGNGAITIVTDNNETSDVLTATVTFSYEGTSSTISVTKKGATKALSVSPTALTLNATERNKTAAITSNLAWTATSSAPGWCTVSPASGNGNASLTITTEDNSSANATMATITITSELGTKTIAITKLGTEGYNLYTDSLALVALYNSTGGANWNTQWILTTPIATWPNKEIADVGGQQRIIRLNLWNNNLAGVFPADIGNLTALVRLAVQGNTITGNLPAEIGNMTALQELMIQENKIEGTIPESIGQLVNLQTCWADKNNITEALPASFSNLVNITQFTMHGNRMSGTTPQEVKNMPNWNIISSGMCPQQSGYTLDVCQ